ncbi:MAG: NIL domain-containing protein [Dehalococcoidales bacterium]|nr:NIL domain-containing protein [Dehalococcoidales bacterium]
MVKKCIALNFSPEIITEPIIYNLGQQFSLVTNIMRADLTEERGWIELELNGKEEDIKAGIVWAISRGVRITPINGEAI